MAITALEVAWVAWVITVVGWLLSPVIAFFLPKILSGLDSDASQKLRDLQANIIPELENTLQAIDQKRMLKRGKKPNSTVSTLDDMARWLRHAREDAEDIFDDAQHKIVTRFRHRLYGAAATSIARCVGVLSMHRVSDSDPPRHFGALLNELADKLRHRLYGAVATCKSSCVRLLQWSGMVNYGGYCGSVYGAVESSMWIALQWPGKIISGCWHGLRGAVESICTRWIASITQSGSTQQLPRERNLAQEHVHGAAASHDHALDIPEEAPSGSASHEEAVSEATPSGSASVPEAVSEATPSGSASVPEAVSEATPSGSASVPEAVSEATPSGSASVPEAVSEATPSGSASVPEAVSEATPSGSASVPEAVSEAMPSGSASHEQALIPVATPWCSSFDLFKNHCRSIFYWLVDKYEKASFYRDWYEKASFYRDWSYEVVGITNNQENAGVLDSVLTAISRRNLKQRIEKVESTINDVKKSPLLSAPNDIANKDTSKTIRIATTRTVFGREELRDHVMKKLRDMPLCNASISSASPCYSVIGIYGVAGSGKTTFAQYIRDYIKQECKEEKLFDTIIRIHVSETFSVDDIFHQMLMDITNNQHSDITHHEELELKLKESLGGKRFFLILDDLWVKNKNDPQLQELISPLNAGLKGSKILVTARTKVSAGVIGADELIKMPDLDEDQYLSMFMYYALGGTGAADEKFERVGRVIARKLRGSPIAAVIVAGRLGANRDMSFWKNIAELDMLNDTMDALWWSYQQLSPDIRRCFEYCNIFPRRFEMKKDDLVHLWIAQGLVKTSCAREDMEDVAEGYIQELVSCSFLQPEKKTWTSKEYFTIHDLLHDLADMVTRTDCFRIENESNQRGEGWKGDIPRDVRHLFIQNYDEELFTEKKILGLGNLRTLIINVLGRDTQVEEKVIDIICKKLPKLRVLALALIKKYDSIREHKKFSVPESVGQLKYLRYLAFRTKKSCKITLPSTLNNLQHIQLLDFGDVDISEFTFAELVNLRHIFCWTGVKFPYVGRLSSLRTLPFFKVSNEQGYELKQLRELNKLGGELEIYGLENVKSKGQALQANLAAKERLTKLSLSWSYNDDTGCNLEVETDVLEGLCPPVGLKRLQLGNFVSLRYPDWMVGEHNSGPKYLQELLLWGCSLPVPASGLAEAFPHLRVLELEKCNWDALPDNMEQLTSLKELKIYVCKNIRSLPTLPQSLEMFILHSCNDEFTKSCQTVGHPNWQKIEHIPTKGFW